MPVLRSLLDEAAKSRRGFLLPLPVLSFTQKCAETKQKAVTPLRENFLSEAILLAPKGRNAKAWANGPGCGEEDRAALKGRDTRSAYFAPTGLESQCQSLSRGFTP
jgi:hypothetical protein